MRSPLTVATAALLLVGALAGAGCLGGDRDPGGAPPAACPDRTPPTQGPDGACPTPAPPCPEGTMPDGRGGCVEDPCPDADCPGPGPPRPSNRTPPGNGTAPPAPEQNVTWNWTSPGTASIRPGVQTETHAKQCTANFVFTNATDVFLGQAAHCSAGGSPADFQDGCETPPGRLGAGVQVQGASRPGTLVYSSWIAMQERGETDASACRFNDFALVRLDPADHRAVNPALRFYGGPTEAADPGSAQVGTRLLTYGNTWLRQGVATIQPREGYVIAREGDGWSTQAYFETPGVPGDSGSPVLVADGKGLGILVTVAYAPTTGSNGITNLAPALAYAQERGGIEGLRLEAWDQLHEGRLPA